MRVNGRPLDSVAILDRGFQYGDGVFETMAAVKGRLPLWARHFARLKTGCETLGFSCPAQHLLRDDALVAAAESPRCIVKIVVTRGQGGQAYRPPAKAVPLRAVTTRPWHTFPDIFWNEGIRLHQCRTRLAVGSPMAGLKHLNRLEQVLARQEWQDDGTPEGLMLDHDDHVVGGTMTNIFLVEGSSLVTPVLDRCGVAGVMRGLVQHQAQTQDLPVTQETVTLKRVVRADGIFVTNAVIGIWPVMEFAQTKYDVPLLVRRLQKHVMRIIGGRP